jgi:hypothetical protein
VAGEPRALIPSEEETSVNPHQQPRTYRIRLFEGGYQEHLKGEHHIAILDFSAGPGLLATKGELNGLIQALAWKAGARGEKTLTFHLSIEDETTGDRRCTWPATTWFDPNQ